MDRLNAEDHTRAWVTLLYRNICTFALDNALDGPSNFHQQTFYGQGKYRS